ncbi:unnamed protein product [Hymenolepis diminuta]|uniref:BPTI/Kunitz inhibitor domain-containing protein n=1 Tax=Hymenolepis diminuta TaxID=6216 RepID=A0A564YRV4_HYMDI|nr:unnamed protein product [Hymenolepis diminuta]
MIAAFVLISLFAISFSEARFDPCTMPIERGHCRAYIPSWGMDVNTGECVKFIYGGCQGNLNRFSSKERCEYACGHLLKH